MSVVVELGLGLMDRRTSEPYGPMGPTVGPMPMGRRTKSPMPMGRRTNEP